MEKISFFLRDTMKDTMKARFGLVFLRGDNWNNNLKQLEMEFLFSFFSGQDFLVPYQDGVLLPRKLMALAVPSKIYLNDSYFMINRKNTISAVKFDDVFKIMMMSPK